MTNTLRSIFTSALLLAAALAGAQTQVNPATQIKWPKLTGSGAPTASCAAANYGQPYQDTSTTPNNWYTCGSDGWAIRGSGGSGTVNTSGSPASGDIAAFSASATITTATATQVNTLIKTLTGCNTATYLYSPQSGTCVAPSSGGVQYNPATTVHAVLSFSGLYDDNHALSSAVGISSYTCSGSGSAQTCAVVASSAMSLTAGTSWVDMNSATGWPTNTISATTYYTLLPVTAVADSTHFTISVPKQTATTCSSSCGNVYDATYYGIIQTANQPFIKGHGTVWGVEDTIQDAATNFSTKVAPLCSGGATPCYLIMEGGQNELDASVSAATIEGYMLSVWQQAHAAGFIVVQGSTTAANFGGFPPAGLFYQMALLNQWIPGNAESFTNSASGQYWDRMVDYNAYLNFRGPSYGMSLGGAASAAYMFAQRTNEAIGSQSSSVTGPPPLWNQGGPANDVAYFNAGQPTRFYDNSGYEWMTWGDNSSGGGDLTVRDEYGNNIGIGHYTPNNTGEYTHFLAGHDSGTKNTFLWTFNYASSGSSSNYMAFAPMGGTDFLRLFVNGGMQLPQFTSTGIQLWCLDASGNVVVGSSCSSGTSFTSPNNTINISGSVIDINLGKSNTWLTSQKISTGSSDATGLTIQASAFAVPSIASVSATGQPTSCQSITVAPGQYLLVIPSTNWSGYSESLSNGFASISSGTTWAYLGAAITNGGADNVCVNGTNGWLGIVLNSVNSGSPVDAAAGVGTTTNATVNSIFTTSYSNDLLIDYATNSAGCTYSGDSSFTNNTYAGDYGRLNFVGYKTAATAGAQASTFGIVSCSYSDAGRAGMVAIRGSATAQTGDLQQLQDSSGTRIGGFGSDAGVDAGLHYVSALPSASTVPGRIYRVRDSTTIVTEGQTCATGSDGNYALAMSNGTTWKCF